MAILIKILAVASAVAEAICRGIILYAAILYIGEWRKRYGDSD